MAAETIRVLLHLYEERAWLSNLARVVSDQQVPDVMREVVRRQVKVEALIAEIESTGQLPTDDKR